MPYGPYTVGQIPYGDAFIVKTPILDKIGQDFHKEQLQKEKEYSDNSSKLDNEFSKNVAGIRDADIDDLTSKYNDYKTTWKQLNKPGHNISPQEQLGLLRKKTEVLKLSNQSKNEKANEDLAAKDVIKNPGNFNDGTNGTVDAHQYLTDRRKKAISQFGDADKDIYGNILYKGNNTDFSGLHKKAEGTLQQRGTTVTTKSPDGLTSTDTNFKAVNSPSEYLMTLNSGIKGSVAKRDFLMQHQYTDDEADNIIKNYTALTQTPEFKQAYPTEQPIPASMLLSPIGKAMALTSMQHALEHPPVTIQGKPYNNTGALMDAKNAEWNRRNKLTFGQSMAKIKANKASGIDPTTGYLSDNVAEDVGKVESLPPIVASSLGLKPADSYTVVYANDIDPARLNIIKAHDKAKGQPGVAGIQIPQSDGSTKEAYIVDPGTGDWIGKDGTKISRERVKDDYIKQVSPTKFKVEAGTKAEEKRVGTHKVVEAKGKTGKKIFIPQ